MRKDAQVRRRKSEEPDQERLAGTGRLEPGVLQRGTRIRAQGLEPWTHCLRVGPEASRHIPQCPVASGSRPSAARRVLPLRGHSPAIRGMVRRKCHVHTLRWRRHNEARTADSSSLSLPGVSRFRAAGLLHPRSAIQAAFLTSYTKTFKPTTACLRYSRDRLWASRAVPPPLAPSYHLAVWDTAGRPATVALGYLFGPGRRRRRGADRWSFNVRPAVLGIANVEWSTGRALRVCRFQRGSTVAREYQPQGRRRFLARWAGDRVSCVSSRITAALKMCRKPARSLATAR